MMNLVQKYNRQILAVVSAMLLVVFLAPTMVTQCGRVSAKPTTVWATTSDGGKLTLADLDEMRGQLAVLDLLRDPISTSLELTRSPEHWWLLVKEAKDAGMVGGVNDGRTYLDAAARAMGRQPEELLGQLAGSARQPPQVVLQTLANLRGVERLIRMTQSAGRMSEARLKIGARELLTDVSCDVVPLSAATLGDSVPVPPPTPDQLTATFEKGKSSLPGTGPGGIGYKFPDRVKLEWLMVPAGNIARSLESDPALGPVELRKEFRRNPAAFGVPAAELGPDKPAPAFDAYATRVRADVERRLIKERAERIAAAVRDWNRIAMKDVPVEGGIAKLPADWAAKRPALAALGAELSAKFGMEKPIEGTSGEAWLTGAEIDSNAFLGKATVQEFGQPMRISQVVGELRDLKADGRLPVQAGVLGPIASTPTDDVLVWRVTEAEASRDPGSMAEVLDAVTKDATAQARYDALAARVPELTDLARTDGIDGVSRKYGTSLQSAPSVHLADPAVLRQYGIRFPGSMPVAGQDVDAIRAVVAKALALPTDRPVSALPEADRVIAVAVPAKLAVIVARVNDVKPLTIEDFRMLESSGNLSAALMQDEPRTDLKVAFGKDAITKRCGFELKNPDGPDRAIAPEAPAF
jgi:hypothetical protein